MRLHSILLISGLVFILIGIDLFGYYLAVVIPAVDRMCPGCANDPTAQWEFGWSIGLIIAGAILALVGIWIRGVLRSGSRVQLPP
jgi:hypothetical protein